MSGPHGSRPVRAGGRGEPGGGGGLRPAACERDERGRAAQTQGVLQVRRAAGLGQGERLPVGREDFRDDRSARGPSSDAAGAGARLPVC